LFSVSHTNKTTTFSKDNYQIKREKKEIESERERERKTRGEGET